MCLRQGPWFRSRLKGMSGEPTPELPVSFSSRRHREKMASTVQEWPSPDTDLPVPSRPVRNRFRFLTSLPGRRVRVGAAFHPAPGAWASSRTRCVSPRLRTVLFCVRTMPSPKIVRSKPGGCRAQRSPRLRGSSWWVRKGGWSSTRRHTATLGMSLLDAGGGRPAKAGGLRAFSHVKQQKVPRAPGTRESCLGQG